MKKKFYIDGANVSHKDNKTILASRIKIALDELDNKGFETHALLPKYILKKIESPEIVKKFVEDGRLTLISNHDDIMLITHAYKNDAFILTNDRFKDHKNKDWWSPELDEFISKRLIPYDIIEEELSIPLDAWSKIEKHLKEISMHQMSVPEFKKQVTNGGVSSDIHFQQLPKPVQDAIKLIPENEITYSDWGSKVKNETGFRLNSLFGHRKYATKFLKSRRYPVRDTKKNIFVKAGVA